MLNKKLFFSTGLTIVLLSSCNHVAEKAKQEAQNAVTQTNEAVQKVINDLGLVYVEEGAQDIITYDEVNAAQQAWCDALVKIGQLKGKAATTKHLLIRFFLIHIIMTMERFFLNQHLLSEIRLLEMTRKEL
jgi:hypothetical protein